MFVPTFSKLARQRFIPEIAARKQIHVDVARSNRILVLEFRLYGVSGFDEYSKRSRFYLLLILFSLSNTCSCQYRIALRFIFHRNLNFSASFMPMEICSFYIHIHIFQDISNIETKKIFSLWLNLKKISFYQHLHHKQTLVIYRFNFHNLQKIHFLKIYC